MLWSIAVLLTGLWCLGLATGYTTGLLIHVLIAAAIILLVINIKQEIVIYDELTEISRAGKRKKAHLRG
ncbi:MAG: hypothetical protein CVU71_10130 [Deltaproteobacteria bacterium HGW-Deltaproteobacteria-6]|jgi:hypothetical protein|nr:MAG: hypothetical protein CVU71_10130 [Deltaproteobacteria bacterium HGW-Deltaproteobacteria-6]